jgi:hypothetical protein
MRLERLKRSNRMAFRQATVFAGSLALCGLAVGLFDAQDVRSAPPRYAERAPSQAIRPFVLGERPFSPASSWNTPIAASATYSPLNWPAGARFGVAWNAYSPAVHVSSAADPFVSVTHPPTWGYKAGVVQVRMPQAANGAPGSDGELLVIEDRIVHNFWRFTRIDASTATAVAYGATDIAIGTGWGRKSPFLGAGIVATGSSQLAGLLVQAETDRGEIAHALQLCIEERLAMPGHVGEAISGDGKYPAGIAREGERLAIPRSTAMPTGLSPLGEKVFRAYQQYGAFVIDVAGGVTNLRAQANAYDQETIKALQRDLPRITPMLQRVE